MFEQLAESLGVDLESPSMRRAEYLAEQNLDLLTALVKVRKDQGLTQKAVADRLGVSQANIAAFEKHGNDPKLSTIRRYAHAVGALVAHRVEADSGQLLDHRKDSWVSMHSAGALNVTGANFGQTRTGHQLMVVPEFRRTDFALSA
jgi:DNA-binding XRE family transcriptional regulator